MTTRAVNPSAALTFPGMSQAVIAGETVHISGQVALDATGAIVGEGDAEVQARQCLSNVAELVTLVGGELSEVVKLTCFLTSADVYPAYAKAKMELFPVNPPAGTAVIVAGLLDTRFLLEVEAVLVLNSGTPENTEKRN